MELFFWGGCGLWNTLLDDYEIDIFLDDYEIDTLFWALTLAYPRNPVCLVFSPSDCLGLVRSRDILFLRVCLMLTPDPDSDSELGPDVSSSKNETME